MGHLSSKNLQRLFWLLCSSLRHAEPRVAMYSNPYVLREMAPLPSFRKGSSPGHGPYGHMTCRLREAFGAFVRRFVIHCVSY
jgi:hypothetical protein